MSRFRLVRAQECDVTGATRQRLRSGTTVADSYANVVSGDVIAPVLCQRPNTGMIALDAAAARVLSAAGGSA